MGLCRIALSCQVLTGGMSQTGVMSLTGQAFQRGVMAPVSSREIFVKNEKYKGPGPHLLNVVEGQEDHHRNLEIQENNVGYCS